MIIAALLAAAAPLSAAPMPQAGKSAPNEDCLRHAYNTSSRMWILGGESSMGDFKFIDCTGLKRTANGGAECYISPGATVAFIYYSSGGISRGAVTIKSPSGAVNVFDYASPNLYQCAKIKHSGSTTGFNLNEPANGDIQFFGNGAKRTVRRKR